MAHASVFRLGVDLVLLVLLGRTLPTPRFVGAGAEIDVEVVHVAGDVRIVEGTVRLIADQAHELTWLPHVGHVAERGDQSERERAAERQLQVRDHKAKRCWKGLLLVRRRISEWWCWNTRPARLAKGNYRESVVGLWLGPLCFRSGRKLFPD